MTSYSHDRDHLSHYTIGCDGVKLFIEAEGGNFERCFQQYKYVYFNLIIFHVSELLQK
jgi:hypothetical protein